MDLILKYFPGLSKKQQEQFGLLQELYTEWNSQINVISRKDIDQLYERHVLHSLSIARFIHFKPGTRILDIGTGGGFPAIPLAIYFPESDFAAVDSIAKKIKVVQGVADSLQLENIKPLCIRGEQIKASFDFVLSRAVAPLSELYKWSGNCISEDSKNEISNGMISLKGGDLKAEIADLKNHRRYLHIHEVKLSDYFMEEFFETKNLVYSFV